MISTSDLQYELRQTAAVFGRNGGVKVVFEGGEAKTDGNTIMLPAMPSDATISDEGAQVIRGFLDHEASHVRNTDMEETDRFMKECKAGGQQPLFRFANALEDIRAERITIGDYPGALKNLNAVGHAVSKQFIKRHAEGEVEADDMRDLSKIGPLAITWAGREGYGSEAFAEAMALLDEDIQTKVRDWVKRLDGCRNTGDVLRLAKEVWEEIGSPMEEPEDPEEEPEWTEGPGGGERRVKGDTSEVFDGEPSQALKTVVEEIAKKEGYCALTTRWDVMPDRESPGCYEETWSAFSALDYDKMRDGMQGEVNAMRTKLERALLAEQRRDWDFGREMGRLDSKRFVSVLAGRANVYKDRTDRKEVDTAVSLLVDLSGSMSRGPGSKRAIAAQCAMALVECVARTGISYEVLGFHNFEEMAIRCVDGVRGDRDKEAEEYKKMQRVLRKAVDSGLIGRTEPLVMPVFKSFDERLHEAKPLIAAIADSLGGNNTDGDALEVAGRRLLNRPEQRKVLMVLSDGHPSACVEGPDGEEPGLLVGHLQSVVRGLEAKGVTTIGVGIQSNSVRNFYPRNVVVGSLQDLSGEAIDLLAKALIGKSVKRVAA